MKELITVVRKLATTLILAGTLSTYVYAESAYNYHSGVSVEIDGDLVEGEEVEIYNYRTGEYTYEDVESYDGETLETYDYSSGEYHEYEMDY